MLPVFRSRASHGLIRPPTCSSRRGLVVVRNGKQVARGLRKDPEDYMSSPSGVRYPGTSENLRPAQQLLGEWSLPDNVLLQALTHKSFAHGKTPYNEKLAILGNQLLRVETIRAAALGSESTSSGYLVNGQNFDIHPNALELLSSSGTLAQAAYLAGLGPSLFWKPADDSDRSATVFSKAISALVGAIVSHHGTEAATQFIEAKLLKGPFSVFQIASETLKNPSKPSAAADSSSASPTQPAHIR